MSFPSAADARRWLALRDTDPIAWAALHPRAREMAQDYDDAVAAQEHRPAESWSRRDERSDELLTLRDGDEEARKRFLALPDHVRDKLQTYEDVVGRPGA